ncbi:MAG: hypothetical protein IJD17_01095, partial [Clostridia bacterium]|nr:hypothetical protein [Clostridia bacterium]
MKKIALVLTVLMILSVFPLTLYAGPDYIIENDTISMPKATPTVDAVISTEDGWSEKAFFNIDTVANFWGIEPLTTTADLYFAYSDAGLYFAGDITDETNENGNNFVYSTGTDDIDDGMYGWNGDIFTLMLDPLEGLFNAGYFGNSDFTPWYHIGLFKNADGSETARMYRNKINEGELTAKDGVVLAGKSTEKGWIVEAFIPWSVIVSDIYDISVGGVSLTEEELAADAANFRGAILYHDRYRKANGTVDTWGRFVTVCETCVDGTPGYWSAGVCIKAMGLKMVNYDHSKHHEWGEWTETLAPTCTADGIESSVCSICGDTRTRSIVSSGEHSFGDWSVSVAPSCTEKGTEIRSCPGCGTTETRDIPAGHSFGDWKITVMPTPEVAGERQRVCSGCGGTETEAVNYEDVFQGVSSNGLTITLKNLYEVNDVFIAKGNYSTYREIKNSGSNIRVSPAKIGDSKDYSLIVAESGEYTVCFRYKDGRDHLIVHHTVEIVRPEIAIDGLQVTVSNLEGIKVIRSAPGEWTTAGEVKRAAGCRNYTNSAIKGADPYTIQYTEGGRYTIAVQYATGYCEVKTVELIKKQSTFVQNGNSVIFGDLEGLQVIRYAPGVHESAYDIKRAEGYKIVRPAAAVDGMITIDGLSSGSYTFCVQYLDQSYNYYTINTHEFGDWYVVNAATTSSDGLERRDCETCDLSEERIIPAIKMTIAGNDISKYKIIYGSSAPSPVKTAANNLASWIKACYGVNLTVTTDAASATEYEILVGKTNRENSGLVSVDRSSSNELSYVINVQGNRLVIAGQTDSSRRRGTLYGAYYF